MPTVLSEAGRQDLQGLGPCCDQFLDCLPPPLRAYSHVAALSLL